MATGSIQNFNYNQKHLLLWWHQAIGTFRCNIKACKISTFYAFFKCLLFNNCWNGNALKSLFSDPCSDISLESELLFLDHKWFNALVIWNSCPIHFRLIIYNLINITLLWTFDVTYIIKWRHLHMRWHSITLHWNWRIEVQKWEILEKHNTFSTKLFVTI